MPHPLRRLSRRITDRLAAPYVLDLATRIGDLNAHLALVNGRVEEANQRLDQVQQSIDAFRVDVSVLGGRSEEQIAALADQAERNQRQTEKIMRQVNDDDMAQRRRLYQLRGDEEYELAFTETDPLVSFVVPTHRRFESLRDVSLPSILAQTHTNVEVIVVGDDAPPEAAEVIAELNDPRLRFYNRTVRGPYPADPSVRWYTIGTPPYNDGVAMARGRWIAGLGDDDSVRPDHVQTLLEAAQANRYEHCYGLHTVHYRSGETIEVGSFPPERGQYVVQTSIYHAGLRFFQMDPADYLFEEPNDWSLCRRMLAAGVRFGMVDHQVADKYESRYESHQDWERGIPVVE